MRIVALQTARAGSKGVPGKNTMTIQGKPLYRHNLDYTAKSKYIDSIYVSTDDDTIIDELYGTEFRRIVRPPTLQGDTGHHEIMLHGLAAIEERNSPVDIIVLIFGNTVGARTRDVDNAISMLINNEELDSVMSVSEYNMFNPLRAFSESGGLLDTVIPQEDIACMVNQSEANDRNILGSVYFFNGSFWVMRRDAMVAANGLQPFPWLGKKIAPFYQETIMELDAPWQIKLLEAGMGFSNWPFRDA